MRAKLKSKALQLLTLLLLFTAGAHEASGIDYYVSLLGSDSNPGTDSEPLRTIQSCADRALAGDTCYVRGGTYDERVTLRNSGTPGSYISFIGHPSDEKPIMRGFTTINKNYTRIIGFEITHNSTAHTHGIGLYASHHFEILNNYFHHIHGQGIRNNAYYGNSNYNIIRGNTITYTGCPTGVAGQCVGHNAIVLLGHHLLIEYNNISRTFDFVDTNGGHNIIRNNHLYDARDYYFPDCTPDAAHIDTWQPFGVPDSDSDNNVFESNWASDNIEANSHFVQIRDETQSGEKEFIIRGNVAYRFGSYIAQLGAIDYVRMYGNTYSDFFNIYPDNRKGWTCIGFNAEHETDASLNSHVFNNILYKVTRPDTRNIIASDSLSNYTASNNACEQSGTHPNCSITSDINFQDYAADNFQLQSSSNARNSGKAITTVTSPSGSGTSFGVADANFFTDGFGIAEGDLIRVGANEPTRIASISGNTIIVDRTLSWNTGDGVNWRNQDETPDIGAFEYRETGYSITNNLNINDGDSVQQRYVTITATVNDPSLVRLVEFWIDNVPVHKDYDHPYEYEWDASAEPEGSSHRIDAIARPLFADKILAYTNSAIIQITAQQDETTNAKSCSKNDVQEAINTAENLSVVLVPPGNCIWDSDVSIPSSKRLILKGAGIDNTTITGAAVSLSQSGSRLTGFTFINGTVSTDGDNWRVDNCKMVSDDGRVGVYARGNNMQNHPTGVIDNNIFINTRSLVAGWAGLLAHELWAQNSGLGSSYSVFIEDNIFIRNVHGNSIDSNYGGRYVFRNNLVIDSTTEAHSLQGNNHRASRSWEIYNNTFRQANRSMWAPFFQRGGTGVIFNNKVEGSWSDPSIVFDIVRTFRDVGGEVGLCNGSSPWDGNEEPNGYPCRDQIGRGIDEWLWTPDNPYPPQALEPVYIWNNKRGTSDVLVRLHNGAQTHLQEGRDYVLSEKPDYTPFNYPHPLRTSGFTADNPPAINPTKPGDTNNDGFVDLADLQIIVASFGKNTGETGYSAAADIAEPIGRVNLFDVMVVVRNWGQRG